MKQLLRTMDELKKDADDIKDGIDLQQREAIHTIFPVLMERVNLCLASVISGKSNGSLVDVLAEVRNQSEDDWYIDAHSDYAMSYLIGLIREQFEAVDGVDCSINYMKEYMKIGSNWDGAHMWMLVGLSESIDHARDTCNDFDQDCTDIEDKQHCYDAGHDCGICPYLQRREST